MTSGAIVACTWGNVLADEVAELLTRARGIADTVSAEVHWLNVGEPPDGADDLAATYGAARVHCLQAPQLDAFRPDFYVEELARYCRRRRPKVLLFIQSFDTRLLAPRLAGQLRCGVVMNSLREEIGEEGRLQVTASAYGGDTHATYVFRGTEPHIVSAMLNAVRPEPAPRSLSPEVEEVPVDLNGTHERVRVVAPAGAQGPRLEDAQVIVAGGRGLGNAANFALVEQLAEALGGVVAASRPIVDDGWTDPSRQVGLTGRITRPALYIAVGISGASQHMAGCSAAKTIVAINRDPDAAIFRYARFGAVGDCLEIVPEMVRAIQKR